MSKISRALQIFEENVGVDRKTVINSIAFVLGVKESSAVVYYYKCKKMSQIKAPVIEEVKEVKEVVAPVKKPKVAYDYGDAVPDFLKKSYEKLGWVI